MCPARLPGAAERYGPEAGYILGLAYDRDYHQADANAPYSRAITSISTPYYSPWHLWNIAQNVTIDSNKRHGILSIRANMSEKTRARAGGPLVIGTGLPRTGTTSLYEALETLGFTPCHHFRVMTMNDAFPYRDIGLWGKAAKTIDKDERQDMLHHLLSKSGCKAAVDYPTSCFIDDMVEMYPNAKVRTLCYLYYLEIAADKRSSSTANAPLPKPGGSH